MNQKTITSTQLLSLSLLTFSLSLTTILTSQPSLAITTCQNSSWISSNITAYDSSGKAIYTMIIPDKCPYGCDIATNRCRDPQFNMWLGPVAEFGILGIIIFIAISILVIKKLSH